jgi:hypothetical protein
VHFESLRTELTLTDRDERSCMPDHNDRRVDMSKTKISKKGSKVDMSHGSEGRAVRDGNSSTGTGMIFYLWVAPVPDPNRDGTGRVFFPTRG